MRVFFVIWANCYCPLLGCTRSQGRWWARVAIRLSHCSELSGHAVHGDWGGRWIRHWRATWSTVCSCAQFVQAGAETSDTGAKAVKPNPHCPWKGHSRRVMLKSKMKEWSLVVLFNHYAFHRWSAQSTARMLSDKLMQMGVSIWDTIHSHSVDMWAWVQQMPRLHGRIGRLSGDVGCRHPVTIHKASLMTGSMGQVWALWHWQEHSTLRLSGPGLRWLLTPLLLQHPSLRQQASWRVWRMVSTFCKVT